VGSPIRGVVGWLPLAAENFSALLEEVQTPALKGLRHVIQAEPAGFMDGKEFNRGVDALLDAGLVYDILIVSQQLTEAIRFVDRHPKQAFVLNHIAKPNIRKHEIETWSRDLHELARRPNVSCKLSGMVTEADTANWSSATLGPYFQVVLEAFGPGRLVVGTDWPVITLGCNYARWWEIVESWIAPLSLADQAAILGQNAVRIYGLEGDRT
jgi:L-fuconolactonase